MAAQAFVQESWVYQSRLVYCNSYIFEGCRKCSAVPHLYFIPQTDMLNNISDLQICQLIDIWTCCIYESCVSSCTNDSFPVSPCYCDIWLLCPTEIFRGLFEFVAFSVGSCWPEKFTAQTPAARFRPKRSMALPTITPELASQMVDKVLMSSWFIHNESYAILGCSWNANKTQQKRDNDREIGQLTTQLFCVNIRTDTWSA